MGDMIKTQTLTTAGSVNGYIQNTNPYSLSTKPIQQSQPKAEDIIEPITNIEYKEPTLPVLSYKAISEISNLKSYYNNISVQLTSNGISVVIDDIKIQIISGNHEIVKGIFNQNKEQLLKIANGIAEALISMERSVKFLKDNIDNIAILSANKNLIDKAHM